MFFFENDEKYLMINWDKKTARLNEKVNINQIFYEWEISWMMISIEENKKLSK